jgi:hypothetical protein
VNVTLQNTDKIVELKYHGAYVPARVWEGTTDSGVPVVAFITRIAVRNDQDLTQFEAELQTVTPPSADVRAWPARMLID